MTVVGNWCASMMRSYIKPSVIITDATRFEFNPRAACGIALMLLASSITHCWCCAELVALSLPLCVQIRAPWWVQTMWWSFFMPFVSVGVLTLTLSAGYGNPLVNLIYSLYYLGFPAGFVCLLFISAWLAIGKAGACLSTNISRMGEGCCVPPSKSSVADYDNGFVRSSKICR
jgi:hypothetical protein